jgi:nicotinamidase-related amidase
MDLSKSDVFVDLCVQRDYLLPGGNRVCVNADAIMPRLRHLMALARWSKLPVLSCVDCRRANDVSDECPGVALNGLPERHKTPFSLLPGYSVVECDNCLCMALDVLQRVQQVIFTKYHRDPFTNPKLDRLLTEMPARRFVVFGVPLESSLRILVLGLLRRERRVTLIEDACGYFNSEEARMAVRQLGVKGCEIIGTEQFVERTLTARNNGHAPRARTRRSVA